MMTMTQVWGCLILLIAAPCLGAFVVFPQGGDRRPTRFNERAQFITELALGMGIIILTRQFFAMTSAWELLGLLALVMGRYWRWQETAMVAVLGGLLLHDYQITLLVGFIGLVGLTFFRQIRRGIWEMITLISLALVIRHGDQSGYIVAAIALSGTLAWISSVAPNNREVWSFFKPEAKFATLDQPLNRSQVGETAATLSQLKQRGYSVLPGWLLGAGDDLFVLLQFLKPDEDRPFMVRLSSEKPSQRFQIPIEQLASAKALESAILSTFSREELGQQSILIQVQPQVIWSGITYSRAPLGYRHSQEPLTEVLADMITPLIVGDRTPLQYYGLEEPTLQEKISPARLPPLTLMQEAAKLSRCLEEEFIAPLSMEWCFDGKQIWILGVRPIQSLKQHWTRDYLQTVVPHPLQPLSASLFKHTAEQAIAEIFQTFTVTPQPKPSISQRSLPAAPPDFVTHYRGYSYYNRTVGDRLLQELDLDWETFPKITNARFRTVLTHPRLFYRYLRWDQDWAKTVAQDIQRQVAPTLKTIRFSRNATENLSLTELNQHIEQLQALTGCLLAHYVRGHIILRTRRSLLKVKQPSAEPPEAQQALLRIARDIQNLLPQGETQTASRAELFAQLADQPDGKNIFQQIEQWLTEYGHRGDYPWELAQKRWQEDAGGIRKRITKLLNNQTSSASPSPSFGKQSWRQESLSRTEKRLKTIEDFIYHCLAQLRWSLLAIADHWVAAEKLDCAADIFWLRLAEINQLSTSTDSATLRLQIQYRRMLQAKTKDKEEQSPPPPILVYGQPKRPEAIADRCLKMSGILKGQSVGTGSIIAKAKRCSRWQQPPRISNNDILIVPYLHERLFPYLPELKGVITTQGSLFSQGARLAREQNLPMIVNVPNALEVIQTGQWLRLDGHSGQVELLPSDCLFINNG
ncbi:PEP-utilizing protein mobile region [[Leptolyngbya] sp. PCC 7376]|uniref:PEP-utilizing enzyme n=1 Tax=[Leptolyngbya] sp. PCC 7376 TaxID=111781 RepID=UPI00029F110E|nr:PEP-utilizing enzyme [[Leptolyngbya] sp. PCC 7376]AFY37292.1 PEP-utilizing protein mobile region [[Leptolyngbya] sp. PCC 7376]